MSNHLIIIGASARAAAQSAIRAGYDPWCIDLFADRDLQAIAPVKRCPREKWPAGVLELMKDAPPGPVLFTGAMENHLDVVKVIQRTRAIWGTDAQSMSGVRDPSVLRRISAQMKSLDSFHALATYPTMSLLRRTRLMAVCIANMALRRPSSRWLLKLVRSAGGAGIKPWWPWQQVPSGCMVQARLLEEARHMSAVFVANAGRCRVLAIHDQIVGDASFGASPFQYVGNVGPLRQHRLGGRGYGLDEIGRLLTTTHGLTGIFGVDFAMATWRNTLFEVNPRFTASVELWERATGHSALAVQRQCRRGIQRALPGQWRGCQGKAIVYAKHDSIVPDLYDVFRADQVGDVPRTGAVIRKGDPICTLFTAGSRRECVPRLREMARLLYTRLETA